MRALQPRKTVVLSLAILALLLASPSFSRASLVYSIDDGTHENSIGLTAGGDLIWLNRLTTDPANNLITTISVAFGSTVNGRQVTVAIWQDNDGPNGVPTHAVLLNTASGVVANQNSDTFNDYSITPTLITGATFLVGIEIHGQAAGEFPANLDTDNPHHQSFVAGGAAGTGNLADLGANQIPVLSEDSIVPGNFMVRATGVPAAAVPEPASLALLGIGGLGLLSYRGWRRRQA
jgi:hypothetical protein